MKQETKHVICRACHAQCGLLVDFENGIPVSSHGDKENPAYFGYSCLKGRELMNYHSIPSRLQSSLKKQPNGKHEPVHWKDAANDSAEKLLKIVEKYGPDSVALYIGTFGFNHLADQSFARAFMNALGSQMVFTSVTIDQPGKIVSNGAHGNWLAGAPRIKEWDGLMLVGTNPVISMNGGLGVNPARNLHEARKRGMNLIVIDPRKTDVALKADLHIQSRPGEDTAVLASIIRELLKSGAIDKEFVSTETEGLSDLTKAVEMFTPELAAQRAGVTSQEIRKAAKMIGGWKSGHFCAGTGPNMSGFGNVVEYLLLTLTSLRGFWKRAGEIKQNAGTFINPLPAIAGATGPFKVNGFGKKLRTRGLDQLLVDLPTAALADEILTPGEGQIKALIVLGGNPVLAWPDQIRTVKAMKALDLLICVDPRMSKTCDYANYVIAPKIHYETHGLTALNEMLGGFGAGWGFDETYAQVCNPIMDPPKGSDLCEGHEFFHAMAAHLDRPLHIRSFAWVNDPHTQAANLTIINPKDKVNGIDAWNAALNGAPISVKDAFADPEMHKGKVTATNGIEIQPKPTGWTGKLMIGELHMMSEIERFKTERLSSDYDTSSSRFPYRLISRRLNDIHNSNWHEVPGLRKRLPHHPAYINPKDMEELKLSEGDIVKITSEISSIKCVVTAAPDVRVGCLAVPHSWGTNTDEIDDPLGAGGNTGRLSPVDKNFDKITGIPLMSAIPVNLELA